jgi:hypothetical protein
MSQRTDKPQIEALGENYGDQVAMEDLRASSPIQPARKTTVQPSRGGGGGMPASLTGFDAPTTMPDVPVTDGVPLGPGAGPEALGLPQSDQEMVRADVAAMHPGFIEAMVKASMRPNATPSYKKYVRQLLANR